MSERPRIPAPPDTDNIKVGGGAVHLTLALVLAAAIFLMVLVHAAHA